MAEFNLPVLFKSKVFTKKPRKIYGITRDCIELEMILSKYMENPIPTILDKAIIPVSFTKMLLLWDIT